jgi:HPt (histidine-containing phosphotransfer) domain-containing protein
VAPQRLEYHQIIKTHLRTAYLLQEEKIHVLLPQFLQSLQALMHNLEQIAATECQEDLGRASHAIKGALLNLGLMELAAVAFALEQNCRSTAPERDSAEIISELKEEISKIV